MTRADPAESNIPDIGTVVDQFSPNYNFHSTFMRLTVHFGVDAGFTLSKVLEADSELKNILSKIGVDFSLAAGITLGGDIYWKPYEPDAAALPDGLETPFVDPATITREQFEQQVLRASEFLDDYQHCGSIWGKSGDLSFGFNFFLKITVFWVPIVNLVLDLATFKIADFNTGECEGLGAPPLAHLGDPNNNVAGPYAAALGLKEVAGTLYVHTATARPANSDDKSQDDTVLISAIATNADGTNDLRVTAQGRTQEFKNVKAIYADGGEGNDSFIVDSTVTIPAEIHDGDGNNHLEYNGSGSASLSTGNGTNSLIGGAGANTLVSGNGNSSIKAAGPGTTSITVGNGDNQIRGGSGVQTILVGNGNNQIQFGAGNSTITLGAGANTIIGGIKGGHVKIIDSTSTDTDHTGKGLVDQLILNGTANPDTVTFATGTLNGLAAVRIDDGTATSTWSVTALNPNAISFLGGGNNGATGRDGSRITVDDLSSTGVATVNINPNLGLILNRQKDAFTVLGTTHADNVFIDAATNQAGVTLGVAVTGLGYTVNLTGMEPAYDTLTLQGNGGNDLFTVGNNSPRTNVTSAGYARVENAFSSFTIQGAAGSSSQVVVSDDADFTLTDTSVTRSTGGAITLHNIAKVILTGGAGANRFTVLNWSGDADLDAMGNIDTLQADWTQDFNGNLNLLGFENAAITVGRDFNGRVSSSQPGTIQQVTIGRALTSTGQLTAGSIDRMTIGPDAFTPGADMAGRIIVAGTLGDLRVAGGTPGTIVAGRVGTVRAYGGYGPVVLQINEAGIQRRVEAATQGMDYPTATASVSPGGVTVQYYYESGSLAHPQLTARVSNSNPSVNPFDLSLVTYHDAAKFNLARLDAAGIAGIRNVAIEGDLRKAVTAGAAGFFKVPTTTPGGVRLGLDALAGVAVRDYAPNGYIQAKSIQAVAFGSHTRSDGKLETGAVAQAVEAARLLAAGTAIVQANNTYRVSFADLPAQQVGFFLATEPRGGKFDSQNIALVVQALTTANAALTANIVTPQNVARGAAIALIKAVPTFDKAGKALNSVVQTIDIRGDGASVVSGLPIAGGITSTGPLGDLNFKSGPIASLTAPSIFGSIGNGPITGIIQTTGLRTDPITGVITSIPADLGRVYVTATTKGPIAVASTMTSNAGFFGQLLVRGNLISQVQAGAGLSGVIAIQGNIATTTAKDIEGRTVRLGGLVVNGSISGQIVTLENVYADVIVNGGLTGGRIAVKGDILGNFIINGILDTTSAVVAGGKIGDAAVGTALKIGEVKGILAAEGSIIFNQTPNTKQAAFFGSNLKTLDAISAAAIDRIFMNNGAPLDFGLDLNGLGLILNKLAALRVIKGKLA
jgi:hypothetical protein